jgi:hypothetical protein
MEGMVRRAREEGLKEGRGKRGIERGDELFNTGYCNNRAYQASAAMSDLSAAFLTGANLNSKIRSCHRERSRSRSRDRDRYRSREKVYIVEREKGRGRKDSLEAVYGGLGKISDGMRRVEGRLIGADFDRHAQMLKDVSCARRYS